MLEVWNGDCFVCVFFINISWWWNWLEICYFVFFLIGLLWGCCVEYLNKIVVFVI